MTDDTLLPFHLPAVQRKKVTAAFDGGLISSDGGLVLLREAERRLGLAETLAGCIRDRRNQAQVVHTLAAMLRFRMLAIACGYEDADDCDALRADPLFKLASGHAPESGRDLCSQPTMSRLENAPSRIEVARMTAALVDIFCRSFPAPPAAITLDIDDTCDPVHGHQQLSLFNAHHDTRCFLPVHVYHVESGKPVAVLLRPGKTPSGAEVRTLLKHLVRRIRRHWPNTRIVFRGDSHYGRTEAMAWCEANGVDYIFGLAGNPVLHALAYDVAVDLKMRRAEAGAEKMRSFAAFAYAARSWSRKRRVIARMEETTRGSDTRYIVTSLERRGPPSLRRCLLRPRPGREPDQAAQGAARLGPNLLPEPARQSAQAGPAHRRLLAHARPARRYSPCSPSRPRRVRHPQAAPAQARRPRRRKGRPRPHPPRLGLPGRRPLPPPRRTPRSSRPLSAGAPCPANPNSLNLQRLPQQAPKPDARRRQGESSRRASVTTEGNAA